MTTAVIQGCAQDQASRYYGSQKYAPKAESDVELLYNLPTRPYDVLADFQSRRESPTDMRRKAAEIGADAVIVAMVGGLRNQSDEWAGQDSQGSTYSRIVATAIRYKDSK